MTRKGITPIFTVVLVLIAIGIGIVYYYDSLSHCVGCNHPSSPKSWQGNIHVISSPCESFTVTPPATGLGPYCKFSFGGAAYQLIVPNDPSSPYMLNFAYGCPPSGSCGPARKMPYENEVVQVNGTSRFDAAAKVYVIDVTGINPPLTFV
jgi:hypothetical protein